MAGYRFPGPTGWSLLEDINDGTMCRLPSRSPGLVTKFFFDFSASATDDETTVAADTKAAKELSFSTKGKDLLKSIESLRLKPYDDQTGKEITAWVKGATIGYGHLIKETEWDTYKDGIDQTQADTLFDTDGSPFVTAVQNKVTAKLKQQEFDALVILTYNIGTGNGGFADSSVLKLVNDPAAVTSYKTLEDAWKAWNKSQGKVMEGLKNRRNCEWKVYTEGVYEKW